MEKVRSLKHLATLAKEKRAVVSECSTICRKPRPAAFIMNLQAWIVVRLLAGGLFVYEKKPKERKVMTWTRQETSR